MYIDYSVKLSEPTVWINVNDQTLVWSQILREYIEIYKN